MAKQASKPKKDINILITQSVEDARILRSIAESKGFDNRKKYIEFLCQQAVQSYNDKQLKLKL